jgi:peptide-methionine (S)-S-oxide reductase
MAQALTLGSLVLLGCDATGPGPASEGSNEPPQPPPLGFIFSPDSTAVLAGGCFWGVEAVFEAVKGVLDVESGYSGGTAATALYPLVVAGVTDHAEVVKVRFDPGQISYRKILEVFFLVAHDPTQLDRQHPDVGPAYRSHVFYLGDDQRSVVQEYVEELDAMGTFTDPIVTRIDRLEAFYRAEENHQDFVAKNPNDAYVRRYDLPKLVDLQRAFPDLYAP